MQQPVGLGDPLAQFKVYIGNRPNFAEHLELSSVLPMQLSEIHAIGQHCGNGWRKVFNVYAKLVFALGSDCLLPISGIQSWQKYRDGTLLQAESNTSLMFSKPELVENQKTKDDIIHIIMGKTYAKSFDFADSLVWLDDEFAVQPQSNLIVCPYFDYRQLSNIKIIRLVDMIKPLLR